MVGDEERTMDRVLVHDLSKDNSERLTCLFTYLLFIVREGSVSCDRKILVGTTEFGLFHLTVRDPLHVCDTSIKLFYIRDKTVKYIPLLLEGWD